MYGKKILWSQWLTANVIFNLQNILFRVQQKEEIHTGLEQHAVK